MVHPVAHAELLLLLLNSRKIKRLKLPLWPHMHHLHAYPDLRAMFRRLLIAALIGVLAALAVAGFRHAMLLLEWLFLSNNTGSLVNAATNLSPLRRMLTPALGGLAAGLLLWAGKNLTVYAHRLPLIIWKLYKPTDNLTSVQAW